MSVISYPIPSYANVPIDISVFSPQKFEISTVTRGRTTIVTTTSTHDYVIGQLVRFIIPTQFGIRELNEQPGYVISLPSTTQVEVQIDSSSYNSFTSSTATTRPQILAIGDINQGDINTSGRTNNGTFIPGSFINT